MYNIDMYIHIKVKTLAKKDLLTSISKDHFQADVKDKAERNMANKKVLTLVAEHFKVNAGQVRIINGHHSPSKLLNIDID